MKWFKLILVLLIFHCSVMTLVAQDACEVTLNMATEEFSTGHFYGVPELLSPCLNKGQSREWRLRAYLLLTETYLLLDDPIGAKESYLKVLEANPEYVPKPEQDPIDLVYFSSKFTASPKFSVLASTGANISQVIVLKDLNAMTSNPLASNPISKKYSTRMGYQFGGGLEYHYDENFSASAELRFTHSSYKKSTINGFERDELTIIDKQNWIRLPLSIKFSDHKGKYRPYGYLGYSFDFLRSDKALLTSINNDLKITDKGETIIVANPPSESPLKDFTSRRYRTNQSFFIGAGLKYKVKLNYFYVDIRYSMGLRNLVNPETAIYKYNGQDKTSNEHLETGEDTFERGHVDDIFRMNNVLLSFGYIHPFYKPRELKHAKTKSILNRIKKHHDE